MSDSALAEMPTICLDHDPPDGSCELCVGFASWTHSYYDDISDTLKFRDLDPNQFNANTTVITDARPLGPDSS